PRIDVLDKIRLRIRKEMKLALVAVEPTAQGQLVLGAVQIKLDGNEQLVRCEIEGVSGEAERDGLPGSQEGLGEGGMAILPVGDWFAGPAGGDRLKGRVEEQPLVHFPMLVAAAAGAVQKNRA